jgi:hypothetical protein
MATFKSFSRRISSWDACAIDITPGNRDKNMPKRTMDLIPKEKRPFAFLHPFLTALGTLCSVLKLSIVCNNEKGVGK